MKSPAVNRTLREISPNPLAKIETFPALELPGIAHAFTLRAEGVDVATTDKAEALSRLHDSHLEAVRSLGFEEGSLRTTEQVHGETIVEVDKSTGTDVIAGADGLITGDPGVLLGIYVADCCAVYLVDRHHRGIALLHSGKKGTELGIVPDAITMMGDKLSIPPSDLIAQLCPCIRPPAYEIDFAAQIRAQCLSSGIAADQIHDPGVCTSHDLDSYYSYRIEKGATGRMLALLGMKPATA